MMAITLPVLDRLQLAPGRLPIRYRLLILFTVPLAVWILVSALNITVWNHAVENSERLINSQRKILLANEYINAALRAQGAKRAYLMTSNDGFLSIYEDAANVANEVHIDLVELNRGELSHLDTLQDAGNLFQEWLYEVAWRRIEARQALPPEVMREAQELQKMLLMLQDAHIRSNGDTPPPDDVVNTIRSNVRTLFEHEVLVRRRVELREASQALDEYADMKGNGDENSKRALREAVALLTRAIQVVADNDRELRIAIARGQQQALLVRFQDTMAEYIDAENRQLIEYQQVMEHADRRGRLLLWLGPALGLLMMVAITGWTSRRISRSLEGISRAARGLARGEVGARARVRGSDEFAMLAERFNSMAALVENRSRESAALAELGELLQSSTSIDEAARIFADLAEKLFPGQPGALYLVSPSRDEVTATTFWHDGEIFSESAFAPDDCWALRLSRPHENGTRKTVECEHLRLAERSSVCLPLHAFGETMGMLFVVSPPEKQSQNAADEGQRRGFLDTVAEQLALALANLRMRETLRNQSIRDPLTQLYNRRYLDETFRRELHRAARRDVPLAVLTFDIDHFKRFNDTHGHDGGDALLKAVGNSLRDFFRAEDGAFRSGGEEFVAILPETTLEDAHHRAEELRREIASLEVRHGNMILPPVTISVGVACFPQHGNTTQALLKAADLALYRAKENGRNRVMDPD